MKKRTTSWVALAAAGVAAVALGTGGAAAAVSSWHGVVVAKDAKRKTIITASPQGVVRTLRVTSFAKFRIGQRVSVRGTKLRDGTYRSYRAAVSGRAAKTKLRGVVIRHQANRYLLSAGSSVVAVRTAPRRHTAAASVSRGSKPGDRVLMSVSLTQGTPTATTVQTVGHTQTLELEGIFLGLAPDGKIRLAVAERGEVQVSVPAGTQLPTLTPGAELELDVTVGAAGEFTVAGAVAGTEDSDSADDTPSTGDDDDSVDTPSVDKPKVDKPKVDKPSVDTPSVDVDDGSVDDVDDDQQEDVDDGSVDDDDEGDVDDDHGSNSGHGDDGSGDK